MKLKRLACAAAVLTLAACSPKALDKAGAAKLINDHPSFAAPVEKLPLAADIVETSVGVDAGVLEGVWRYGARGSDGRPQRELTEKGKQAFKDGAGTLAVPAKRELAEVSDPVDDKDNKKHKSADFTWRYQISPIAQRFTGTDGTFRGHAELQYDGAWKVATLTLDAKPGPFPWTAEVGAEVRKQLAAEQEATTQRMLALEPQKFRAPGTGLPYSITVADVYIAIDDDSGRRQVSFLEFRDCKVEDAGGAVNLRVEGIRQTVLAPAAIAARADLEKICGITREAYQSWVAHNPEVAARGPLGVSNSR
jgi:hypothetical protein